MTMTNTVRELKENMETMMDVYKRKFVDAMFDDEFIDAEIIEVMRGMFNMCDLSMKLVEQQAEIIEGMDKKLDKLLEKNS